MDTASTRREASRAAHQNAVGVLRTVPDSAGDFSSRSGRFGVSCSYRSDTRPQPTMHAWCRRSKDLRSFVMAKRRRFEPRLDTAESLVSILLPLRPLGKGLTRLQFSKSSQNRESDIPPEGSFRAAIPLLVTDGDPISRRGGPPGDQRRSRTCKRWGDLAVLPRVDRLRHDETC